MGNGIFYNFFGRRFKGKSVLGWEYGFFLRLKWNAAYAIGITSWGGRYWTFPSTNKKISCNGKELPPGNQFTELQYLPIPGVNSTYGLSWYIIINEFQKRNKLDILSTGKLFRNNLAKIHLVFFTEPGQYFIYIGLKGFCVTRFKSHPFVFHLVPELFDTVQLIALYTSQKLFINQSLTSDTKLSNGTVVDYESPYESTT